MAPSDAAERSQAVAALTSALCPGGVFAYPEPVVLDVLALLILSSSTLEAVAPHEQTILAGFATRAGITTMPPEKLVAHIADYAKRTLPGALMVQIELILREFSTMGAPAVEHASALLGQAADAASRVPVQQREPSAGAVRMGVLGRFGLQVPPKK